MSQLTERAIEAERPTRTFWKRGAMALLIFWIGTTVAPSVAADADSFVRDATGNLSYIVELDPTAAKSFAPQAADPSRFPSFHKGPSANLILSIEAQYGFRVRRITTWSSTSFTAFLTAAEVEWLRGDPRVKKILFDTTIALSADTSAVWSSSTLPTGEIQGWGKKATNQLTTQSSGSALIYVVDAGVGLHADLNVVEWVTPFAIPVTPTHYPGAPPPTKCGSRLATSCNQQQATYMVSCYTHSTAVAGVAGAYAGTSTGIQGVNPGAAIVSVTILDSNSNDGTGATSSQPDFSHNCMNLPALPNTLSTSNVKSALDWVAQDIQSTNNTGRPSVVNLSLNASNDPGFSGLATDMQALANATPGAFIAQAAGNFFEDSCTHAYSHQICLPLSNDGIMVVGAINNHGQPVVPLNGLPGMWEDFAAFGHEPGSDWGAGVEVWAPGERVDITVADDYILRFGKQIFYQNGYPLTDPSQPYNPVTNPLKPYTAVSVGSGTSFAAPHVAGLASYFIETNASLTSASLVETYIRNHFSNLNSFAPTGVVSGGIIQASGAPINIATNSPLPANVPHSTVYSEYAMANVCFAPMFATGAAGCGIQLPISNASYAYNEPSLLGTSFMRNGQILTRSANAPIWVSTDSYGSGNGSCSLSANVLPSGTGGSFFTGPRYYGASLTNYPTPAAGSYWFFSSSNCTSANFTLQY